MRLNEIEFTDVQPVEGYGAGFFRIGGKAHAAPLVLHPGGILPWKGLDDLDPLLGLTGIDILLIGMGPDIAHLPAPFRSQLEATGLGVEVMSSPQACRTFNVLLGEGRRVGLAVLPV